MAEKKFDHSDPMSLNGMILEMPKEESEKVEGEMAACFIEEYMRLGFDEEKIFALFKNPFYQGTHALLQSRGEEYIRGLIREVCGVKEGG